MKTPAVLAVLFLAAIPVFPATAEMPPVGQDWIVTEDTLIYDMTIHMGLYSLRVRPGATLELNDVILRFNQTSSTGGIFVDRGAVLRMNRCALNDVSKTVRPCFVVQGTLELTDCDINRLGSYNRSGGIEIERGQATVTRCRFANMSYNGLSCADSVVTVESTYFFSNNYAGIYSYTSTLDVRNCTFRGYSSGLQAFSSQVNLSRSAFSMENLGVYLDSCTATVIGCGFVNDDSIPVELPPVNPGAVGPEKADLAIVGCDFSQNEDGCHLSASSISSSYFGAGFSRCIKSIIMNCSFAGFYSDGISSGGIPTVEVRDCHFLNSSQGVYAYGYTADRCTIRDSLFTGSPYQSNALYTPSGGVRFENNTVTYPSGAEDYPVRSYGPSAILNNRIVSGVQSSLPGIMFNSLYSSDIAEVSGNRIDGFSDGIYDYSTWGQLLAENNTITNCSNGVNVSSNAEFRGNIMDVAENGIRMPYYGRTDWPDRLVIAGNRIDCSREGIRVLADIDLRITDNQIVTCSTGIALARATSPLGSVVISGNRIEAVAAGIEVDAAPSVVERGSVDNNTVLGAQYGMRLNRSAAPVRDNSMDNITRCGILARDCNGNFSRALRSFSGERSANTTREIRSWTVTLDVQFNINPPNDPERLLPCLNYDVGVSDQRGVIRIDFDLRNQTMELVEYQVLANGSRFEYNPYQITVSSPGKGAVRTSSMIFERAHMLLRLVKAPDLVATSLDLSDRLPVEGELLLFCATAENNDSFNPDGAKALFPELRLLLDGVELTGFELPVFYDGAVQPLTAAWIATPGWHNLTFDVDARDSVIEVFEDNNRITIPFHVMPLPSGELTSNDSEPGVGRPVGFSINSSGSVVAYRFDFGDGSQSDWLPEPRAVHVYLRPGDFIVKGSMVTGTGIIRECRAPFLIRVGNYPSGAALKAYPDPARSGQPVLLTMTISGWGVNLSHQIWYFGDGGYGYCTTLSQTEHVYQRPGNYTVECVLGFVDGSSRIYRLVLSVGNALPFAAGRVLPASGTAGTLFTFSSESRDPDGNILSCRWDFGDGETSLAPYSTHSFGRHGVFIVNLTVQDNLGQWSLPRSFPVQVDNTPPSARIGPVKGDSVPGSRLSFDGSATTDIDDPPTALSYSWDFGDGSSAAGKKASHSYSRAGRYTVALTVSDGAGGISTKTAVVEVRDAAGLDTGLQLAAAFALAAAVLVTASVLLLRLRKKGRDRAVAGRLPGSAQAARNNNGPKRSNDRKPAGTQRPR